MQIVKSISMEFAKLVPKDTILTLHSTASRYLHFVEPMMQIQVTAPHAIMGIS